MSKKLSCLVADDHPAMIEAVCDVLEEHGIEIVGRARDGEEALHKLETRKPSVAIVDLRMPGIGGWDVVQHLKKTCPETDVIIHTGHGDIDDAIQAVRMGAYDFLRKPCTLVEIANVLSRVAEKKLLANKAIAMFERQQV